jgi:hypothetical protein
LTEAHIYFIKKSKVLKKILPLFSYIFHPIFIPAMATLFYLFFYGDNFVSQEKLFVFFQVLIVTVVIPILAYFLLRATGNIDSVMAAKASQRKIPLLFHCFLIIFLVRKSITIDLYPELHFFLLGGLMSSLLALILLFIRIKASLHMIAISSLTVFIIGINLHLQIQNFLTVAALLLINGLVATSRLEMKAHTNRELFLGFVLGIIPQFLLLALWL